MTTHFLCFYCGAPMLLRNNTSLQADLMAMAAIKPGDPHSKKFVRKMRQTREHLVRKADGGRDNRANIVHAHAVCNVMRQERSVELHKAYIATLIRDGTHPLQRLIDGHRVMLALHARAGT